jgi:Arc/MetJ-type ribon-helix-helix transcriptional regulator
MKVSVSLPEEDVEFLDEYVRKRGFPSRSAVVQRAVSLLRAGGLLAAYDEAFDDWAVSEDAAIWEQSVGDAWAR